MSKIPPAEDPRRSSAAALRNRDAIARELARLAPKRGRALEIASGSGEHVVRFAAAMPGLAWQPSDPDPVQRASIAAWVAAERPSNVAQPSDLDVTRDGWDDEVGQVDLVVLVNLLHLIPEDGAFRALDGIARVLRPGGCAAIYGPFLRDGETTSEGDAAFHSMLKSRDPGIGYKEVTDVAARLVSNGLALSETVRMPANNLLLIFWRP